MGLGSCNIIHLIIHLNSLKKKKKPVLFTQLPQYSLPAVRPESETIRMLIERRDDEIYFLGATAANFVDPFI